MRGKHAAVAATKREQASYESELSECQRQIRNLTRDRDVLRSEVERWKSLHASDTRLLRAQLDKQTHPELEKALDRIRGLEAQLEDSKALVKHNQRHWESVIERLVPWYAAEFKMSQVAALENLGPLIGMKPDGSLTEEVLPIVFDPHTAKLGGKRAREIQRARGVYTR